MGVDFVLCLRSSSLHVAPAISWQRAVLNAGEGSLSDGRGRRRRLLAIVAMGGSIRSNYEGSFQPEGNPHHFFHHQQRHHQQHPHHYHSHHHHIDTGPMNFHGNCNRLGPRVSDKSDPCNVKEHGHNSILHGLNCSPLVDWKNSRADLNIAGGAVAGVGLPLSLKILKRRQQDQSLVLLASAVCGVGNPLLKAFSSLVFMVKELQSHTLCLLRDSLQQEIGGLLNQIQREVHASFLWLFQQVFSCTPELMILLMVLLADFTACSMANNLPMVSMRLSALPSAMVSSQQVHSPVAVRFNEGLQASLERAVRFPFFVNDSAGDHVDDSGWHGNGGGRRHIDFTTFGGGDGDPEPDKGSDDVSKAPYTLEGNVPPELSSMDMASLALGEWTADEGLTADLAETHSSAPADSLCKDEDPYTAEKHPLHVLEFSEYAEKVCTHLNQETKQSLVAPFSVSLQEDCYTCYDKTDWSYQCAIGEDPSNPMLCTNYAQFLFLVRKDHDRAEELFRRAVRCNPLDADAASRFASFLWLARRNLAGAEKAYQAAVRADPSNPFHAANYAHFLWNSAM